MQFFCLLSLTRFSLTVKSVIFSNEWLKSTSPQIKYDRIKRETGTDWNWERHFHNRDSIYNLFTLLNINKSRPRTKRDNLQVSILILNQAIKKRVIPALAAWRHNTACVLNVIHDGEFLILIGWSMAWIRFHHCCQVRWPSYNFNTFFIK